MGRSGYDVSMTAPGSAAAEAAARGRDKRPGGSTPRPARPARLPTPKAATPTERTSAGSDDLERTPRAQAAALPAPAQAARPPVMESGFLDPRMPMASPQQHTDDQGQYSQDPFGVQSLQQYGRSASQFSAVQAQYGAVQGQFSNGQNRYNARQNQFGARQNQQFGAAQNQHFGGGQYQYNVGQNQFGAGQNQQFVVGSAEQSFEATPQNQGPFSTYGPGTQPSMISALGPSYMASSAPPVYSQGNWPNVPASMYSAYPDPVVSSPNDNDVPYVSLDGLPHIAEEGQESGSTRGRGAQGGRPEGNKRTKFE